MTRKQRHEQRKGRLTASQSARQPGPLARFQAASPAGLGEPEPEKRLHMPDAHKMRVGGVWKLTHYIADFDREQGFVNGWSDRV